MADFERIYGSRASYATTFWDSMDAYFREGGGKAWVARVLDATAVEASLTIGTWTKVTANGAGTWGNALKVGTVAGVGAGSVQVVVQDAASALLEMSPEFTTKPDLLAWEGQYVHIVDTTPADVTMPPVTAPASMTGGVFTSASVVEADYIKALSTLGLNLGPGQVSIPGITTSTGHKAILAHAAQKNRVAILDAPDNSTAAGLISAVTAIRQDVNARYGAMFAPRVIIPGVVPNTVREIPYSPIQAGLISRSFEQLQPAAGVNGISRIGLAVKYEWTDVERQQLNEGGVDIVRNMDNTIRTYGYRTLVDPVKLPAWVQLNTTRIVMAVKAQAEVAAESHVFRNIDGKGIEIASLHGDLVAICVQFYNQNALYGSKPDEAFAVDTGSAVNTPESIARGELRANVMLRTSPFSELVVINIIKVPLPSTGVDASLV
jgi:hypothetical protein